MLAKLGALFLASVATLVAATPAPGGSTNDVLSPSVKRQARHAIAPKVFIISMFAPEAEVWYGIPEFNLLERNITVPGFSPLFPQAQCTMNGEICQLVTGEAEINAAVTVGALVASPEFDLKSTYFFIAGIGGGSPLRTTTGSATFARYAVQVALQYEIDPRDLGLNVSTGYFPFHTNAPNMYPQEWYGTEVFEVNDALRKKAVSFARRATLVDSAAAASYRANYAANASYGPAILGPSVQECDVATSDVYYSGDILSSNFEIYTSVITNGTGVYCSSAEEDNATLEALMRGAMAGVLDFGRIIVMRTISDFDRPYPGEDPLFHLVSANSGGFDIALANIYKAGVQVVQGILSGWKSEFEKGIKPTNYIGDIFETLGGTADFGPGKTAASTGVSLRRRGLGYRRR
ncbi:NUP-domain-containing protein [Punctularia strigosozonata HHB-11173 SS5]|uniref:NUP-domain-containing protein n=1 Tax=Punctularia strigosozonata (strain HHB-11173) TaxID=741275 RepID=UPI0004416A99|nr:NUP-domain-containing protein [Punctularia strigosozonata HHB-11173 SS5]EIN06736.1 NUP-domain-containing protein [Punctularia strigosozonata HHB-11173 SS5]